jgi:hypothetical protein
MDIHQRILQEAVDQACAQGADILHDPGRKATWSPQDRRVWIRLHHDDRCGVSLERLRHWSEGYASYSRRVDLLKPDGMTRFRRLVADEVSLVARLQRRDLETEARCGTRYEPCPTTFRCHPVGLALALHSGCPSAEICSAALERVGSGDRAVQDSHDAISRAHPDRAINHRIRIRAETIRFRDIDLVDLSYSDHRAEGPVLTVACGVPETALVAIGGMTLGQAVDHPALDGLAPVAIRKAVRTTMDARPAIAIHLQRISAPLASKDIAA